MHKVAFLPHGTKILFGLADFRCSDLEWVDGIPDEVIDKKITDLDATYNIVAYSSTKAWLCSLAGVRAKVSMLIAEPKAIQFLSHKFWPFIVGRKFHKIFAWDPAICTALDNAVYFPFAENQLSVDLDIVVERSKLCSIIVSKKKSTKGHLLRHEVVSYIRASSLPIDIMGRGYNEFASKNDVLPKYYYSIVIENSREDTYFSEKIVDCFLAKTIPIYWGAPDVGEFFDLSGVLIFSSIEDMDQSIKLMSRDHYHGVLDVVERNYQAALKYINVRPRISAILDPLSTP